MRLLELDPQFLRREVWACERGPTPECAFVHNEPTTHEVWAPVEILFDADGVEFLCPKCFATNEGPVGTHAIVCWRPRVPPDVAPKPGRWEFQGTGLNDLTLVAWSPSILLDGSGCGAHFYIRNGAVENA